MTGSGLQEKKCQTLESEQWVYGLSLKRHAMLHEKVNNIVLYRVPNVPHSAIGYVSKKN